MNIFNGALSGILSGAKEIISEFHISPEEKKKFETELKKLAQEQEIKIAELAERRDKERTKRLKIDMSSDSWLSKNIRPMTLAFLLIVITLLAFADSFEFLNFDVKSGYINLYETLLLTSISFYMGGRTFEKIAHTKNNKKED